ncbi:hypothetical protein P168DRAFT_311147 [Aspergillus campestris IBT 28561]|uniref:Uncharacterized protein n=1 Tax=Aspergillus campestris (strain IBT 28561) TaxID=1392248 RepID=A0A2I1D0Z0_ASPC2|nr:uncharacterized protein P168DRAFT_311147 [Aspergillus campestris IBT 28561]PKY03518.1 hypothetical protein P168DRAFT_311147 [Aspergillus campestris IBT 28561]
MPILPTTSSQFPSTSSTVGFLQPTSNMSPSLSPGPDDPLLQLVKEVKQEPSTTNQRFQKFLEERQQALQQDKTRHQYIAFTSIPPAQSSLDLLIALDLRAMNIHREMRPFGSTTTTDPALTNARLRVVVEVGLSESAGQLAVDAPITISIKREAPEIIIQTWELVPRGEGAVTRSPPLSARQTYQGSTTTTTTNLTLPFSKVVGRPHRQPLERDLVIPGQELRRFAEDIWSEQNIL